LASARTAAELEATDQQVRARPRKLRQGPVTREQILDSSLRLFSERGFARTSVRDIAQAVGITDAAIYYHFASKRELFEALIEERGFTAALAELETVEITVGPEEAIHELAAAALAFIYRNRDLMKVLMVEAMADDPVATEEYQILSDRWRKAEARIIRFYADRGQLRTDDCDELAQHLVVTVLGVLADFMMSSAVAPDDGSVPPELTRHVRAAMEHLLKGTLAKGT
jgi:AcrR family transcriptional regulator